MRVNSVILEECKKKLATPQFKVTKLSGAEEIPKAQFVTTVADVVIIPLAPTELYPSGDIPVIVSISGTPADFYYEVLRWKSEQNQASWEIQISGDPSFQYYRSHNVSTDEYKTGPAEIAIWKKPSDLNNIDQAFACTRKQYWKIRSLSMPPSPWSEIASFTVEFKLS